MDKLVTITGMTCSGKTTLENDMVNHESKLFSKVISTTTRPIRPGEVDGIDYYFISPEEYTLRTFVEHVSFDGYVYGVEKRELERHFVHDKIPVIVCEPNGASQFAIYADLKNIVHLAIILEPNFDEALKRFVKRDILNPVKSETKSEASIITRAVNRFMVMADQERYWDTEMIRNFPITPRLVASYGLYDRESRKDNIISDVITYLELPTS